MIAGAFRRGGGGGGYGVRGGGGGGGCVGPVAIIDQQFFRVGRRTLGQPHCSSTSQWRAPLVLGPVACLRGD